MSNLIPINSYQYPQFDPLPKPQGVRSGKDFVLYYLILTDVMIWPSLLGKNHVL